MATAFFRTVILYILLTAGLRLMGKRQIGELEPTELVLTLIVSDLAAVPMQDFGIPLLNGVIPIVTLMCLSMLLSYLSLKSVRLRSLLCGRPAIIIRDGQLEQRAMKQNRFTLDELYEQLRGQGITDLRAVKYAILETGGKLSVLPYARETPITPKVLGLAEDDDMMLPILLINDGRVLSGHLRDAGYDRSWLQQQLSDRGLSAPQQVFLLTVDGRGDVMCIKKEGIS